MGEFVSIAAVGHVDHGKSTLLGRLMVDTKTISKGRIEQIKADCLARDRVFHYANLIDALSTEKDQGITIDIARASLKLGKREYLFLDAPGHRAFLKNMITGASRADAALMVLDITKGIQSNTLRHTHLLSLLNVKQVIILVNKMDLVNYEQTPYEELVKKYKSVLKNYLIEPQAFIPVSGQEGVNLTVPAKQEIPWYSGPCLLEAISKLTPFPDLSHLPLRLVVQDVYSFTQAKMGRKAIAGQIDSGTLKSTEKMVFYPSGEKGTVKAMIRFPNKTLKKAQAGESIGLTLKDKSKVKRGEIGCLPHEDPPQISQRILAHVCWLGKSPLRMNKDYVLRLGTAEVYARLTQIISTLNLDSLAFEESKAYQIAPQDMAKCILELDRPLAFETHDLHPTLSRFVIVKDFIIQGGGIILKNSAQTIQTQITLKDRIQAFSHTPAIVQLKGSIKAAQALEAHLFREGYQVYGMAFKNRSHLHPQLDVLLQAGLIVIVHQSLPTSIRTQFKGKVVTLNSAYRYSEPGFYPALKAQLLDARVIF